jgi:hypothetical protein
MIRDKIDLRKYAPFLLTASQNISIKNLKFIYEEKDVLEFSKFNILSECEHEFNCSNNSGIEYLVIPSWDNPRFFVPNDKNLIKKIGNLIKPTSFKARMVWNIALFLNGFKAIKLIFRNSIFIKMDKLGGYFLDGNNDSKSKFVIYTGAIGVYQKWTIQEMNETNDILSFTKIGRTKLSKQRILKEKKCLQYLNDFKFEKFEIPNLVDFYSKNDFTIIKQNSCDVSYSQVVNHFSYLHKSVIEELHSKLKKDVSSNSYIDSINKEIDEINIDDITIKPIASLLKINLIKIEAELKSNETLTFTFSHGDFTQWNSFSNGVRLFVFDWEMGSYRMPMWDYFNFIYHSAFLGHKHNEKELHKVILENEKWVKSIVGDLYNLCHKIYLIEIIIHYLQQYKELKQIGIENSVHDLILQFPKFLED